MLRHLVAALIRVGIKGTTGALLLCLLIGTAHAQGISARFGNLSATAGEDFVARAEILDETGAVHRVLFDMRPLGASNWHTIPAKPTGKGAWWAGTFTSTTVPSGLGDAPNFLELKARLFGVRGGLLMEIGAIEPLIVDVLMPLQAIERERIFARFQPKEDEEEELFGLTGYVGTEARAGSSARIRGLIGAGGQVSARSEIVVYVSVGPAFSRPDLLTGGPLVLGFEVGWRLFTRNPATHDWTAFIEPYIATDLRFPGLDPAAGFRAGALLRLSPQIALEGSLGGAVALFRAVEPEEDVDAELGATGGARIILRFGGDEGNPSEEAAK